MKKLISLALVLLLVLAIPAFAEGGDLNGDGKIIVGYISKNLTDPFHAPINAYAQERMDAEVAAGTFTEWTGILDGNTDGPRQCDLAQDCINQGQSFSEAVRSTGIFTSRELRRIEIAERTAKLDIVMQEIADDYQNRVDISAGRRVGRVEPVLIAVLSLVAGLILLSVMLPLLSIMSTL